MTGAVFPAPAPGDVVLCRFPEDLLADVPGPKPRPAIVLAAWEPAVNGEPYQVKVCYGTSNRQYLKPGEFEITAAAHPADLQAAGLAGDTKFNPADAVRLPYTGEWFAIPPHPRFGQTPKLGALTPLAVKRLLAAAQK